MPGLSLKHSQNLAGHSYDAPRHVESQGHRLFTAEVKVEVQATHRNTNCERLWVRSESIGQRSLYLALAAADGLVLLSTRE